MLKSVVLFCLLSLIFSAPTSCNFQKTNVLSFSEDEDTYTLDYKKSCYEKNICTFSCNKIKLQCNKIIFVDLGKKSKYLEDYVKSCLEPKTQKVKDNFLYHFGPIALMLKLQATLNTGGINNANIKNMMRMAEFAKQVNDVDKNVQKFVKKVRRVCAKSGKLTAIEQVKILLGVDITGFQENIVKTLESFIKDASVILAENCECSSFINPIPTQFKLLSSTLCQKMCKRP